MKNESARLATLLAEGKITEQDFESLSAALHTNASGLKLGEMMFNPFRRVAGAKALAYGMLIAVLMSAIAAGANLYFPGALDLQMNPSPLSSWISNFGVLFYQNVIAILSVGLVFFLSALVLKQKDLRIIDFIGMAALARIAYLPSTIVLSIVSLANKEALLDPKSNLVISLLVATVALPSIVWLGVTYFNAYREASGLAKKKLWASYFIALIVAEALSIPLARLLLN